MSENENHIPRPADDSGKVPNGTEGFRTVPNDSASFGNVPKASEPFRTVRNDAESFRNVPKHSEREEDHTLTVREVARMFETAGVARTERSITNWCQPNKLGVARLDAYFDPNERRYFITPQSAEQAIGEEKAKAAKGQSSEPVESIPKDSEREQNPALKPSEIDIGEVTELKKQVRDLEITNRAKDLYIDRLDKERDAFGMERQGYVEKLMQFNRKVGELETKLLQLGGSDGRNDISSQKLGDFNPRIGG